MTRRIFSLLLLQNLLFVLVRSQNVDDLIAKVFRNDSNDGLRWIPSDHEVVSTTPLPSLKSLERCGEGSQKGLKVCVNYDRCDGETNMILPEPNTDGAGLIDIRSGFSECSHYLDVCCTVPDDGKIPTPPPTTTSATPTVPPVIISYCGIRNPNGLDFTITGNVNGETEYGEFPWVLAILKTNYNPAVDKSLAICGASLITPQVALTGAHCVAKYKNDLSQIKVRAGEWDTLTEKERYPYQERNVDRAIIHEGFNDETLANDYALLLLDRPFVQAKNLGTICLPPAGQVINAKNCFTGGWGKKEFGSKTAYSNILKKIELPTVPHRDCQTQLRKTRLGVHFELHKSFVCAGEVGKDACTGDGGSPLVCPDPNNPQRYVQVGIVAWGIGCGDVPGVYADVAGGRQWIDAKMLELGFNNDAPYTL